MREQGWVEWSFSCYTALALTSNMTSFLVAHECEVDLSDECMGGAKQKIRCWFSLSSSVSEKRNVLWHCMQSSLLWGFWQFYKAIQNMAGPYGILCLWCG